MVGSAVAYFLRLAASHRVLVLERDPSYATASSALSASAIRQQFSCPVNIALSRYGLEFIRDAASALAIDGDGPALGFHEGGYLYLASAAGVDVLRANHAIQQAHDVDTVLLEPDALAARFPWLCLDEVALGSLGRSGEGWFDGPALHRALRRKAIALGAEFRHAEAVGFERSGTSITAIRLADGERVPCGAAVNAAGPMAGRVAAWAGVRLPVEARRRSVFVVQCRAELPSCPLVIDTTGVWFRPEGDRFLAGWSPPEQDDPERLDLDVDHHQWDEIVWPALAARVPAFESVRVSGAWAGHYDYNVFDHNALLGRLDEPANLYFATGFSGHGMQQAAGAGRAIAELIQSGRSVSLDVSDLDVGRIVTGQAVRELNII